MGGAPQRRFWGYNERLQTNQASFQRQIKKRFIYILLQIFTCLRPGDVGHVGVVQAEHLGATVLSIPQAWTVYYDSSELYYDSSELYYDSSELYYDSSELYYERNSPASRCSSSP